MDSHSSTKPVTPLSTLTDEQLRAEIRADEEEAYGRQVELRPGDAGAWFELGKVRLRRGRAAEAEAPLRKAVELDPGPARYWSALASALFFLQRWDETIRACHQAISREPKDSVAWSMLGAAQWVLGDLAAADEAYQRSLQIKPDDPATVKNYTRVLLSRWGPVEALRILSGVIGEGAAAATAWVAAGDVLLEAELYDAGIQAYQRALDLSPGDQPLQYKVLGAITREGPPERAEPLILQRLEVEGRLPKWLALLAQLRLRQARVAEGAEALRTALLTEPNPVQHSTLLTLLQYGDGVRPEMLLADHRSWDRLYAAPLFPNPPPAVERARGDGRLRLGFVSFDFARHPVGYMVLPMLEHLDKSQCQVFCYLVDRTRRLGQYTSRFRAAADRWSHVVDAADDALAQEIREDRIDILFDLSGHHGKRLLVFARKPAPLQVTWFGYVGTTGMRAMDYLLADRFHVAPGEERFYCERVLRMPHGYACYEPPPDSPEIGPLPAQSAGRVTFGCFNNPFKINPTMIDAWARILHAVPDSQLLLKFRGYEQEEMRDRIRVEFAQRKIEVRRIVFEGWSEASQELLSTYNRVDLALDTLPYCGGLTTCEALWMGVPVITHPGRTFAGRHAVSHLTNAGFPQFVARDRNGYVELAIQWANRLDELAAIRGQMRQQMRQSPLCDAPQFARDFLSLMNETIGEVEQT